MHLKDREKACEAVFNLFESHPIVAILGPRQCGKTTLSRLFQKQVKTDVTRFDLEDPLDLAKLTNPKLMLSELSGLIIIDEIQKKPDLFPILRVLVDDPNNNKQFLILGSASRELIQQSSESLAGRIYYLELTPFNGEEVNDFQKLWLRGGFPKSYLAKDQEHSSLWLKGYIKTYLEQDIPNLGFKIPAATLHRFWMMLAHYHGQIFNASELGQSLGIADTTCKRYLDILTGTFMMRQLHPWIENIKKRQVKNSKIFFRDSGIFHSLLGIQTKSELLHHPKLGASWEGFALEETLRHMDKVADDCFFWGIHSQAELDLLVFKNGKRIGFEFKFSDSPKVTSSLKISMDSLNLDQAYIIIPGKTQFKLASNIFVNGLETVYDL